MSAVTAAIIIGSTPRVGSGIIPRWIALLHEGSSYAWHLLRLQLSVGELGDDSRDDPPGVLWRASSRDDIAGELALLLHMYAARTPEIIQLTKRIRSLQRRRVDLSGLQGAERGALENAIRVARSRGRELRLSAQILPGSLLTDEHLLSLPDWELEVCYSAFSRDWSHADGGRLVIRERTTEDIVELVDLTVVDGPDDLDEEFLDDSDTHAVADHPGNLAAVAAAGADGMLDGLVIAAEAQSEIAGMAAEKASSITAADGGDSSTLGYAHHAGGQAPGAASAWLERNESPPYGPRTRGLLDRLRNR